MKQMSANAAAEGLVLRGSEHQAGAMPRARAAPREVVRELEKHVLLDGFRIVVDLERSDGWRLVDAVTGRQWVDFYGFYGSMPVGFNHPRLQTREVQEELLQAARAKVAISDVYSVL